VTEETRPLDATIDRLPAELFGAYAKLSPNDICDVVELSCVMRHEIHSLWGPGMPRIAGPAFTIRTGRHDNLMFHASI
jgi:4-hydroxy-4-methyl-2-oxoglutarate aldolase